MADQHKVVVSKLDQRAQKAELHEKAANAKYTSIYEKYLEIQKQLNFVHEQAQEKKQEEQLKALTKNKRREAKRQHLRQTVSIEEFRDIMKHCVKGRSDFIKVKITALTLLYLAGLRVSNIRLINVGQLKQLLEKGYTEIQLIKRGSRRHPIRLAYKGTQLLKEVKEHVDTITKGKDHDKPAFTVKSEDEEAISEHTLERELNVLLKQASNLLRKHVRTHSFRATVVTELLNRKVPLHEVQQVIGHRSIGATLAYNRNRLTVKEIDNEQKVPA